MLEIGTKWAPTKKLLAVIEKLKSLMVAPSNENALNGAAAQDYSKNPQEWFKKASEMTKQHAKWSTIQSSYQYKSN